MTYPVLLITETTSHNCTALYSLYRASTKLPQNSRPHTLEKVKCNAKKTGFGVKCGFKSLFCTLQPGWPCVGHGYPRASCGTGGLQTPAAIRFLWWLSEMTMRGSQHAHVLITASSFLLPFAHSEEASPTCSLHANFNLALLHSTRLFLFYSQLLSLSELSAVIKPKQRTQSLKKDSFL